MTAQKPLLVEKKPLAIRADLSERQIQRYQPALPDAAPSNPEFDQFDNRSPLRGLVIAGLATILVSFGGFFAWGFSVELSSATVANGTIIVDSKRKTISHFEGGVMNRLLVQEGDKVTVGQPLIELEDTRARSSLRSLQARRIGLIAKLARLKSEQNDAPQISFPSDFGDAWDVAMDDSVRAETIFLKSGARPRSDASRSREKRSRNTSNWRRHTISRSRRSTGKSASSGSTARRWTHW